MTKENHIDYVEFPASSEELLKKAQLFYSSVFGWKFKEWAPNYVDTASAGIASGINADPGQRPQAPLVITYTEKLEDKRARVLAAGGQIIKDIFAFPGGRRFEYADPAGNRLGVWSDK